MAGKSRLQRAALGILDPWLRFALLPFRRQRRGSRTSENPQHIARTAEYNAAAERYYAEFPDRTFLLNKPFSEPASLSKHLIDTGILLTTLQVTPGDTVVEIGAGTCWLSQLLNRYGCRTIAIDVSPTALAI